MGRVDAPGGPDESRGPGWGVRRVLRLGLTGLLAAGMVLGAVGHVVRDRTVVLALLMYIPLVPLGLGALLLDLCCRGRCVRPARFGFGAIGFVVAAWAAVPLVGTKRPDQVPAGSNVVTLLHWNMQSGGRSANLPRWRRAAEHILSRNPDLIVLSEPPPDGWLFDSLHGIGHGWRTVRIVNDPFANYWYKPTVCSRWPMRLEREVRLRNGAGMAVTAVVRGSTVRLLVVDGISHPLVPRTPMLHDIAAECDAAARRGEPFDVVVGDFNSVGRSLGFREVAGAGGGYRRASDYYRGWRATWPMPLPVYDIDHAWVRTPLAVTGSEIFGSPRFDTDHRGQFVHIAVPAGPGGDTGRR